MSSKRVLEKGVGLLQPNELSTAVLNVVGTLVTSDGTEQVFERQESVKHLLGTSAFFFHIVRVCVCVCTCLCNENIGFSSTQFNLCEYHYPRRFPKSIIYLVYTITLHQNT